MPNNNAIPDFYRDNEKHVENFADHLRQTALDKKNTVAAIAHDEVHRFRDVTFGVNTQYSGSQLRIRNSDNSVLTKLKQGAQMKILDPSSTIDRPDNDRGQGHDDSHILVLVEADAADTQKGGTGKVQGWVSTEYIRPLSTPVEPAPIIVAEPIPPVATPPEVVAQEDPKTWKYPENSAENAPVPGDGMPENTNPAENAPIPGKKPDDNSNPAENAPVPGDKIPEDTNTAGDLPVPQKKPDNNSNPAENAPIPENKPSENSNPAGNSPAPGKKPDENTDSNTPGDIPPPKKKVDTLLGTQIPPKQGLWSKFVSLNLSIMKKVLSPFKEEIAAANTIANGNNSKQS